MTSRARPATTPAVTPAGEALRARGPADSAPAAALGLAALGALSLAVGALLPVTATGARGFASAPLLIVLALLPIAVAGLLVRRGRPMFAAGVLAGLAALVPGRLLVDLQLLVDAAVAARPELYLATDLDSPAVGPGLWLLCAGHVATAAAGVLAARRIRSEAEAEGADTEGVRRLLAGALGLALLAGVGLVMAPFGSEDPYLLARNAFEAPWPVFTGGVLLVAGLPLAAALLLGSGVRAAARGGLLGLALGVLAVAGPGLVAGLAVPAVSVSAGPIVALAAAVLLALAALVRGDREGPALSGDDTDGGAAKAGEASLPGARRMELVTGTLAVLTGVAGVIGGLTAPVTGSSPLVEAPASPASPLLLAAGLLFGVLGLGLFVPAAAVRVRPVLAVAWVAVPFAGTAVLETVLVSGKLSGLLSPGPAVVWNSIALSAAAVTGVCAWVTGLVEREQAEEEDGAAAPQRSLTPIVATGVLVIAAYVTPVVTAPDYDPPALLSGFGASWSGVLLAALTALGALVLAVAGNAVRAPALLAGVALLLALRAAELPLVGGGIDGSAAGIGCWLAIAAVLASVISAISVHRANGAPES